VVLPAPLPVLRVDEVDPPVLVRPTGGLPPIEVLEPGDRRPWQLVEPAQERDGAMEVELPVLPAEGRQLPIDLSTLANPRKRHPHGGLEPLFPWARGAENTGGPPVSQFRCEVRRHEAETRAQRGFSRLWFE